MLMVPSNELLEMFMKSIIPKGNESHVFVPYCFPGINAKLILDFQRLEVEIRVPLKTDNLLLLYEVGEGTRCVFRKRPVLPP